MQDELVMQDEFNHAVVLSNRVLDRPSGDPDDDLAMLARQFQRSVEREQFVIARMQHVLGLSVAGFEMLIGMLDCMGTTVDLKKKETVRSALDKLRRLQEQIPFIREQPAP